MDDRIKVYLKRVNDMLASDPFYRRLSKKIDKGYSSYKIIQKKFRTCSSKTDFYVSLWVPSERTDR